MEPITTAVSIVLGKIVLEKFYEGVSSKLGEKVVEKALAPIEALGKLLWDRCVLGKPKVEALVVQAEKQDDVAIEKLKEHLAIAFEDQKLKAEVETIVQEIHSLIDLDIEEMSGGEVWNVSGGTAKKEVFTDNKAPIFKDVQNSPITINNNYGTKPD
jgi:hypothetical protein